MRRLRVTDDDLFNAYLTEINAPGYWGLLHLGMAQKLPSVKSQASYALRGGFVIGLHDDTKSGLSQKYSSHAFSITNILTGIY